LKFVQTEMAASGMEPCTPWFLPNANTDSRMCDPWEAVAVATFAQSFDEDDCGDCLPDCETTK
jgi:hypothetical protein